ncbi:MAG: heparinase II/III family protein [Rikenellaceae bacterium]
MKKVISAILAVVLPAIFFAQSFAQTLSFEPKAHPRLFADKAVMRSTQKAVKKDPYWRDVDKFIIDEATLILAKSPSTHRVVGRRLLGTSREVLCRVFYLSYAYRTTGDTKFADRAVEEMLAVSAFEDWNPTHYLDAAEMTAAMAIGYDWLYSYLTPETRDKVAEGIIEKGLKTSYVRNTQWMENKNNWNQVCHTGISLGAIVVWEREPEMCQEIVERAISKIQIPMANYNPDGAYAEGPGYWEYGTLFNAVFLSALDSAFGSDYGLIEKNPGFQKTLNYITQMISPNKNLCNFGDNALKANFNIAPFWFANKFGAEENLSPLFGIDVTRQRFLPMAILWGHKFSSTSGKVPAENFWVADGQIPVAVMRSEWGNPDAQFVGVKLGTCAVSHSHIDIGSFIYEADGVRWATDMSADNYDKLEKAGVDLWNRATDAQRWDVYRYGNGQHNVVTINNKNLDVTARVVFDKSEKREGEMMVGYDLTKLYGPWLEKAYRTVTLNTDDELLIIDDKLTTSKRFAKMDWTLMTESEPELVEGGVLLRKDGKRMLVSAETNFEGGEWHFEEAVGSYSFDSANPDIYRVRFTADLNTNFENSIVVTFKKQ